MANCPGHVVAHLAAALPNHLALEILDAGEDALLQVDHTIVSGRMVLADSPGAGIRPAAAPASTWNSTERHQSCCPTRY